MTIERASQGDLAMRARAAHSRVPEQLGAVVLLDPGDLSPEELRRLVATRLGTVPRLRQRLVRVPPGGGRPIWVDDAGFDPMTAVGVRTCPAPGDERALLDLAAELACTPVDRARPQWAATLVTGLAEGRTALVAVLHHTVADGIGGLAVLGRLVDGAASVPSPTRPPPSYRELVADAAGSKLDAVRGAPAAWRALRASGAAGGGLHPPPAAPCSLLAGTGTRRTFAVARADLAALHAAAGAAGGTVNDAVLAAVGTALSALLDGRGESVPEFRVAVMVATGAAGEGNAVAPLVVGVPAAGSVAERLRRLAGVVRRERATVPSTRAFAVVAPLFRAVVVLGLYRWWLARQRRFHTLVSDVPGPARPLRLGDAAVRAIVPFAVGDIGNVVVSFLCLSYAGTLTVTAVADPDRVRDLPVLARALQSALDELCAARSRVPG